MAKAQAQAKTETLNRIDPDEDFSDVDGDPRTEFALDESTLDPDKHYHWAHNDPDDIGQYTGGQLGYRVEHLEDGGVRPKMGYGIKPGEAIVKRDHVLISCDKALWDKRERFLKKKTQDNNRAMFKKLQSPIDLRKE
jgi:hypothetical protein